MLLSHLFVRTLLSGIPQAGLYEISRVSLRLRPSDKISKLCLCAKSSPTSAAWCQQAMEHCTIENQADTIRIFYIPDNFFSVICKTKDT